jgi:hypothetical protein
MDSAVIDRHSGTESQWDITERLNVSQFEDLLFVVFVVRVSQADNFLLLERRSVTDARTRDRTLASLSCMVNAGCPLTEREQQQTQIQ